MNTGITLTETATEAQQLALVNVLNELARIEGELNTAMDNFRIHFNSNLSGVIRYQAIELALHRSLEEHIMNNTMTPEFLSKYTRALQEHRAAAVAHDNARTGNIVVQ